MQTLLVATEPKMRRLLDDVLMRRGHEVQACASPDAGWETYQKAQQPLIMIGQIDEESLALCRRIRGEKKEEPVVVFVVTHDTPEGLQRAFEAGAEDCFACAPDDDKFDIRMAFVEQRVRQRLERKDAERRMVTQYATANILTSSDSLEEATPKVLQAICENLDWDWGELWGPDDKGDKLRCVEIWHAPAVSLPDFEEATHQTSFAPGVGLPGTVWMEGEPRWIPEVTRHPNFVRSQEAAEEGMHSAFAFPIRLGDRILGVMAFFSAEIREPDEQQLRMFSVIGNQIGQFAERRRTKQALRRSTARLTRAQEIANLGSWEYDLMSGGVTWSDQMHRIYGVEPEAFTPTFDTILAFFPPDERQRIQQAVEADRAERATFSAEHRIQLPGGDERWVFSQAELSVTEDDRPRRLVGTELDITDLKQARRALQESEAHAQAILETTVDGIITIDERGRIQSFNQAAEEIFGYSEDEVLGRNVKMLMPSPYREEHDEYLRSYRETGRREIIGIGREVTGQRKDGSTFPMDLAVSEVDLGDRRVFTGIVRDITERRRLEKELLKVTEQERRRIGQDLHDGLGQMLTGIGLLSQNLTRQLEKKNLDEAEDASEITELVKEADQYARDLARGLTPVDLDASGLSKALQRLVANAERLFDIECHYDEVGSPEIHNSTAATHLYRIAQEAVSNAVRHGKADTIKISLASGPEQIRLRIRDDGTGFPGEDVEGTDAERDDPESEGMGVRIMNYRARIIGGTLEISSNLGDGTVVTCTVPRTAPKAAEPALGG